MHRPETSAARPMRQSTTVTPFSLAALFLCLPFAAAAQVLTISNGVHTYSALTNTTVTLTGRCELWVTATNNPAPGCVIHLNSPEAWFFLPNIRPSVIASNYLTQVWVNGASAIADSNVRVVQFAMGAVVIPHPATLQPMQVFEGPHFTGASMLLGRYTAYGGTNLGAMNEAIRSFKLTRGYLATVAQNENGSGISKCYVAQDNDLEVSLLPSNLKISFVRIFPWRWVSKKGIAGNIASGLNVRWFYNWNIDANSTRDLEYVPIRQTQVWPGLGQNWQTRGATHLLGYNEPDRPDQADLSVADAIGSWPDLLSTGLRVGAPAVSDGGLSWLYSFIDEADAAGLRVDFVPVHYYRCYNPSDPSGTATQFYNFLKGIYDRVQRPLWVTEWNNGANWTGCGDPTFAQQQGAIAEMIEMLDDSPFVERYALYNWVEDVRRVKWDDGSLTAAGVTYRDKLSPRSYVQDLPNAGTRGVAQFLFEEDTLDTSGFGNNGFAVGSPAYAARNVNSAAIVFDGANSFIQLPPNVANSAAFSFAAWVYWNGGGNWQRIFDFGDDTAHYLFLTPRSASGTLRFAIRNGGSEQIVEAPGLPAGQWQHVAVTLTGSNARLYTNGVLAAASSSFTLLPSQFTPAKNYLGESQFPADPLFRGQLDDVQIADFVLSPAQVAALMTNSPPRFNARLISRPGGTNGVPYSGSIAAEASDPDGNTVVFSKATGPAWLIVAPNGTLAGTPGAGDGGINYFTVRATDPAGASDFAVLTISLPIVFADGKWISDASGNWSDTNHWSRGFIANGPGYTADFSTVDLSANRTVTLDSSRVIGALAFADSSGTRTWTLDSVGGSVLTLDNGAGSPSIRASDTAAILCPLAGASGFSKEGSGTLILGASNSLTGTVEIDTGSTTANDGVVRVAHPAALARVSRIQIENNNDGSSTLQLDGTAGGIVIPGRLEISCRSVETATIQNITGTNTLAGFVALNVGGSLFNIQSDAGQLVFAGTNQYVGSSTGARSYAFSGAGHHLVAGPILNSANGAPISLIKSGPGTLTLGATNTYGGTTTITGGVLLVNGLIRTGAVTVAGGGATLGGNGTILGPVTVGSAGRLAPGTSIGKLTARNSLVLQAGSAARMEINKTPLTNDVLQTTGPLTYGGALVVTKLAGTLAPGDAFKLFEAPSYGGAFTSFVLPPLNVGLAWDTAGLTNGIISVIATNPPAITGYELQGSDVFHLTGSGSASQPYQLLMATNLSPPISWTSVGNTTADTNGAFQFTDSQLSNIAQRFYRLQSGP